MIRAILTTDEVAEVFGLCPRKVRAMARDGRLPVFRIEGYRRLLFQDLELLQALGIRYKAALRTYLKRRRAAERKDRVHKAFLNGYWAGRRDVAQQQTHASAARSG
jgi:excisionase family DNA binding protein